MMTPIITAVEEVVEKKTRAPQMVFEVIWHVLVEGQPEEVKKLVSGKDFAAAFFKARRYGKENVSGQLVSMVVRQDIIL